MYKITYNEKDQVMKYMSSMGGLYKMSNTQFIKYLKDRINGVCPKPDQYGKYLGQLANVDHMDISFMKHMIEVEKIVKGKKI